MPSTSLSMPGGRSGGICLTCSSKLHPSGLSFGHRHFPPLSTHISRSRSTPLTRQSSYPNSQPQHGQMFHVASRPLSPQGGSPTSKPQTWHRVVTTIVLLISAAEGAPLPPGGAPGLV